MDSTVRHKIRLISDIILFRTTGGTPVPQRKKKVDFRF